MFGSLRCVGCALGLLLLSAGLTQGQALRGRVSLQMQGSSIERSVAPGFHLDAQLPIVRGLSIVGGAGMSAFILEGRVDGTYTFDPELTLKITLPSASKGANTVFGGVGYHIPFGADAVEAAPTVHLGLGRIWTLRESTLFVDVSATAVVRTETIGLLMPLRAGIVF